MPRTAAFAEDNVGVAEQQGAAAGERHAMTARTGRMRHGRAAMFMLLALACLARPAFAAQPFFNGQLSRPEPQTLVPPSPQTQQPGLSREQAAGVVQRRTGGRVLSTTPVQRGGAIGYEVRVLVDGKRVKNVFVDAQGNIRGQD